MTTSSKRIDTYVPAAPGHFRLVMPVKAGNTSANGHWVRVSWGTTHRWPVIAWRWETGFDAAFSDPVTYGDTTGTYGPDDDGASVTSKEAIEFPDGRVMDWEGNWFLSAAAWENAFEPKAARP